MMFKGDKVVFIGLIVMIISLIVVLIGMIIRVDNERKFTMNIIKEERNEEELYKLHNGLGGNHKGDHLYELVKKKAENTLTD